MSCFDGVPSAAGLPYAPRMTRHDTGPRRSRSIESFLRPSRVVAAVALLALVGAIISDSTQETFWDRNALLTSLAGRSARQLLQGDPFASEYRKKGVPSRRELS